MADNTVYLEKMALFGRLLREDGLTAGPRETEDACRLLIDLGLQDRTTVQTALRTVFAKSREEQERFDRVFDSFFLPEDTIHAMEEKARQQKAEDQRRLQEAGEDLNRSSGPFTYSEAQKEAYAALPESEKERLRELKEKYIGEDSRNPELYGSFIHSVFARSILEQQMMMEDAALGAGPRDPELGLLARDLTEFKDTEIPKAVNHIQTLARQLNGELTRRRKGSRHDSALDFRRTIRKGLQTGGTLTDPVYRRKRSRRRQLVILCDVSGSMIQFSEFVLRFIRSLNQVSAGSRIFLFSEELFEADPFRLQNMDRFRDYVRQSGVYGRGTALGAALQNLNSRVPPVFSPSTVLLIVSDAKTTDRETAVQELLKARARAGKILWLNPIPERKWKYLRSIQIMAELCPMIPCSTLNELSAACRRLAYL